MPNASKGGGVPERRTSGLAVASLVLGMAGLVLCFLGPALGVPAVVLGIVALRRIGREKTGLSGAGMAVAGVVMGGLSVALLPLVGIVAAVAVPALLQSRAASNEALAVASLRRFASAQHSYHKTDHDGDGVYEYAYPCVKLHPVGLIDQEFADASRDNPPGGETVPKSGYVFVDIVAGADGEAYCDGRGNLEMNFGLCAVPSEYGGTGRNTFIIGADCIVYRKDTGGEPVTRYPSLGGDGWVPVGF